MGGYKKYYIYVWYRADDHKPFYVGKGKEGRYDQLVNRNRFFMNVYNKHGGYSKRIEEGLSEQEALKKEIELISEYRKKFTLTNITDGGEGVSGLVHSMVTRKRLSELSRKQWNDAERRDKLIQSRRKSHSNPKVRKKMSVSHSGKKLTNKHKNNIKKTMNSPEISNKMAEYRTKYRMIECIKKDGESIIFYDTRDVVIWLKEQGYKKARLSSVIKCLTGERKTLYGFKFKTLNKESFI